MELTNRVAVVTGGARGMGRAFVEAFLTEGAKVAALDISWDDDHYTRALRERSDALVLTTDVTDEDQVADAYRATISGFGTVDVLVNNAAMLARHSPTTGPMSVLKTERGDWERMFAVNVFGPVTVTKQFIQPMIEKRRGSIIMISSPGGMARVDRSSPAGAGPYRRAPESAGRPRYPQSFPHRVGLELGRGDAALRSAGVCPLSLWERVGVRAGVPRAWLRGRTYETGFP